METSIVGKANEQGLFEYQCYQLRDYSTHKHKSVDDTPYGGGGGMVLCIEPLVNCVETIRNKYPNSKVVYFTPKGKPLNQSLIKSYKTEQEWILVCGHYEGVDQRFIDNWVDLEVSLGDFVLTGGELPALCFADALIRHIPGALGDEMGAHKESFSGEQGLLEHPHYTRPRSFRELDVPQVLLQGDHGAIQKWRDQQSHQLSQSRRPDLIDTAT